MKIKIEKSKKDFEFLCMEATRTIYFFDEVCHYDVRNTLLKLEYLSSINKKPITLQICSPGGSVDAGIVLYDYIKSSKVPIYTHCKGMAASMAAILLGAGKKRTIDKNARVMIHQPSSGCIGKALDIETYAKEVTRIRELLNRLLSEDTGQKLSKVTKDTALDLWLDANEAVKYGIVDKIV